MSVWAKNRIDLFTLKKVNWLRVTSTSDGSNTTAHHCGFNVAPRSQRLSVTAQQLWAQQPHPWTLALHHGPSSFVPMTQVTTGSFHGPLGSGHNPVTWHYYRPISWAHHTRWPTHRPTHSVSGLTQWHAPLHGLGQSAGRVTPWHMPYMVWVSPQTQSLCKPTGVASKVATVEVPS